MNEAEAIDIIVHKNEDTNEETAWGVLYEDGSVRWYDSLDEALYYYPAGHNE